MRTITFLLLSFILSGCWAHTLQTTTLASGGAVIGNLVGGPSGSAIGAGVGVVTSEILLPIESSDITAIPEEQRAEVLKNKQLWMTIESLGWYAGIIFLIIWFIPDPFTIVRRLLMGK